MEWRVRREGGEAPRHQPRRQRRLKNTRCREASRAVASRKYRHIVPLVNPAHLRDHGVVEICAVTAEGRRSARDLDTRSAIKPHPFGPRLRKRFASVLIANVDHQYVPTALNGTPWGTVVDAARRPFQSADRAARSQYEYSSMGLRRTLRWLRKAGNPGTKGLQVTLVALPRLEPSSRYPAGLTTWQRPARSKLRQLRVPATRMPRSTCSPQVLAEAHPRPLHALTFDPIEHDMGGVLGAGLDAEKMTCPIDDQQPQRQGPSHRRRARRQTKY